MTGQLEAFVDGAVSSACLVVVLRFFKYWRLSRDRFFVWFASAFACFALAWGVAAFAPSLGEHGYLVFLPRLVGFTLILVAILDKNRRPP